MNNQLDEKAKRVKSEENSYVSFLKSLAKVRKITKDLKYYHPELTNDELLYGKWDD
jgi:hypothetical protein